MLGVRRGRATPTNPKEDGMATQSSPIQNPRVVSHEQWVTERVAFLAKEKELTRLRDELSRQRRELPWEKVTKSYVFDGPRGKETLADLFEGRSQLIVYHFMFDPAWDEACKSCSFWADNFDGIDVHLAHRDVTLRARSRGRRSRSSRRSSGGWAGASSGSPSFGTDFNYDFGVSFDAEAAKSGAAYYNYGTGAAQVPSEEMPGVSVFYKDRNGDIFHTYSAYSRGLDLLNGTYNYIDLTPKGRDEDGQIMSWLRRHDQYEG